MEYRDLDVTKAVLCTTEAGDGRPDGDRAGQATNVRIVPTGWEDPQMRERTGSHGLALRVWPMRRGSVPEAIELRRPAAMLGLEARADLLPQSAQCLLRGNNARVIECRDLLARDPAKRPNPRCRCPTIAPTGVMERRFAYRPVASLRRELRSEARRLAQVCARCRLLTSHAHRGEGSV